MIRWAKIKRAVKSYLVEVLSIGGTTDNRFISPKGLYSKPKNENAIVLNIAGGTNQDVVLCVQKEIDLEDGDVYLTDDKNFIHFKYNKGIIEIQGDTIFNDNVTINKDLTVKGNILCENNIDAGVAITAGVSVSAPQVVGTTSVSSAGLNFNNHKHSQGSDSNGDSQQNTSTPI